MKEVPLRKKKVIQIIEYRPSEAKMCQNHVINCPTGGTQDDRLFKLLIS